MRFAINHIAAPKLSLEDFFAMARRLGISAVEIRNDLPNVVDAVTPEAVKVAAAADSIDLLSINALYPFNVWSGDLPSRAVKLADYAKKSGARALVLCPLNDGTEVPHANLVEALGAMAPILRERGLVGLVEPLGFTMSSMRTKREAVAAIKAAGAGDIYKLVHDTFHHHLAGEAEIFPEWTGLVHISGVTDASLAVANMLDAHRVLVDAADRLETIAQLRQLRAGGYAGAVSVEPFAAEIHDDPDLEAHLRAGFAYAEQGLT
jgi:2-keto-myo-inositol isomerase